MRHSLLLALAALSLWSASRVAAQAMTVQVNQYRPAPTISDGFAISRPDDRGHLRFGARLDLDYSLNPLVIETVPGDASSERTSLIEHSLAANVAVSFGLFERLVIFAGLPVSFVQQGTAFGGLPGGDGPGIGDVWVGARGRVLGEPEDVFALGVQLRVGLPTALLASGGQRYSGESAVTFAPEVLAEVRPVSMLRITANLGARVRTDSPAVVGPLSVSHELTWGLGVTVDPIDELSLYLEGWGSASFDSFGNASARETTSFEALLGARGRVIEGFWVGGAVGTGLARGYGTPDFRGILSLGYDDGPIRDPVVEPTPETDRDHDGILDDRDGCPDDPEDIDQFEDENGCPDPDNDADGILDGSDQCINQPEDADGFEDEDGCPEADNDQDGVLDHTPDRCPNDPEDRDQWQDEDGCPEPDNDLDTLLDPDDRCPNVPGPVSTGGCPETIRLDSGGIEILQSIEFEVDSDVLLPAAERILEEIRALLAVNTQLTLVRVEGHTDNRLSDEHNLDLSARRARTVVLWLAAHGIDAARMTPFGCGEAHPIGENRTRGGRQRNRRVVFQILEPPASQGGTPVHPDCRAIQ